MAQAPHGIYEIATAEEPIAADSLHLPVDLVHEDVSRRRAARLAPGENAGGEYHGRPPGGRGGPAARSVDEDDVPRDVVDVVGEVVEGQLAVGVEKVLHRPAFFSALLLCYPTPHRKI
ncbi:unnamed protein product [Cuscuta campestris]|uniref:Uncharacterized protein n=1 Tax=Cuscuta campestris TaxID=132261 RepID=A0A484KAQ0_9ASTE|nr:unnamed protein product [Cuscuta campestris]